MSKRMYIVVNDKLTKSQRIPQASHAVAEYVYKHREDSTDWLVNHKTMVVLQASESHLERLAECYQSQGFRDSDLGNMLTAVAFEPMTKQQGEADFKSLRLA